MTAPASGLWEGQGPAPVLGDRPPQPFGIDSRGINQPL